MTSCRPIQSVIIFVINKSDDRAAGVRFCYHSYDYRPNWTPLSPITIIYLKNLNVYQFSKQIKLYHFSEQLENSMK